MGWMLKFVIFTMAFMAVMYGVRNFLGRMRAPEEKPPKKSVLRQPAKPKQMMTCCNHCGVFVPVSQMVRGRFGEYCSKEHCQQKEGSHDKKNG